jgi:hypothetical protein
MDGLSYGADLRARAQGAEATDARHARRRAAQVRARAPPAAPGVRAGAARAPALGAHGRAPRRRLRPGRACSRRAIRRAQTRKRAILMASLEGPAAPPAPTHQRYDAKVERGSELGVEPWVSMADALGWPVDDLVGFPRRARSDRPDETRATVFVGGVEYRARDLYAAGRPAPVLAEKARSWSRIPQRQLARAALVGATLTEERMSATTRRGHTHGRRSRRTSSRSSRSRRRSSPSPSRSSCRGPPR